MSLSPAYALSQLGIDYSNDMDAASQTQAWNDAQTIFAAVKSGTYRTPGFTPVTIDPAKISDSDLLTLENVQNMYAAAVSAGKVGLAHSDTDLVNRYRQLTGGPEFVGQSDLDILGHSHLSVGSMVRTLNSQQAGGTVPILYDPAKAQPIFDALNAQAQLPPPPPPPNTPVTLPVPPGTTMPPNVPFAGPGGSLWIIYVSPFGQVLVRLS